MGVELEAPLIDDRTFAANLTNEGGIDGTIRLLRNVSGLWLLQDCQRSWASEGSVLDDAEVVAQAADAPALRSFIEPNDPTFLAPGDMPGRIRAFCERSGQPVPEGSPAVARCVLESLALKYRQTLDLIAGATGTPPSEVHIVGGGSRNQLLCQWTADATGLPVLAGPEEATVVGNLLAQALALGEIGSLEQAREVVRASFEPTVYEPSGTPEWAEAYDRFKTIAEGSPRPGRAEGRHSMSARVVDVLGPIPVPISRWEPEAATRLVGVDELVYRSNLLGADRALANRGGGNTSAKGTSVDHAGRETRTLWVKGSGTDLASITAAGFAALRLDEILPLRERDVLEDADMVEYLRRCLLAPDQPRPSIETLLHAFVPAAHVDHTHPDAVIALTSSPRGRELAAETFGADAVWLDYERPGFLMSKHIAGLLDESPGARAVLLEKHGLVTWGETGMEAYAATLEFVGRASHALEEAGRGRFGLGGPRVRTLGDDEAMALLAQSLPSLRGALLDDADGVVLHVDRSPEAVAFASSARAPEVSQVGAPCPDHLTSTKHKPLAVDFDPDRHDAVELAEAMRAGVSIYADWYRGYYDRNLDDESRPFALDPAGPRVVLVPGVGIVSSGADAAGARNASDLYRRAIEVQNAAEAAGGFASLSEAEAFAIEYWPLERYKLSQAPPRKELSGRVVLITGGASGIGRATARRLAEAGAHIVVADLNGEGAESVADEIRSAHGEHRALGLGADVTSETAVAEMTRAAVLNYGGFDVLVCSAGIALSAPLTETTIEDWERSYAVLARGYFLPAREAFRTLVAQGRGGSIIFVGSKNALVAGANATAYSSAKAASLHLARCLAEEGGAHAIRVNTVNPDAVIEGSAIWSSEWKTERASAYGVSEADLPSFYRARTTLDVSVYPEDVAEAIAFLAGPRSSKSTGNIINVDGGVPAAYTR